MKKIFIGFIVIAFLLVPSVTMAQSLQEQYQSVLSQLIQLLLQQIEVLQQRLVELQTTVVIGDPLPLGKDKVETIVPVVVTPVKKEKKPDPVDLNFDKPTQEMIDYFYYRPTKNCNGNMKLPDVDYKTRCSMTSDGNPGYPRGTESPFLQFGGGHLPLQWLKDNKILIRDRDEASKFKEIYACEAVIEMTNSGELNMGSPSLKSQECESTLRDWELNKLYR